MGGGGGGRVEMQPISMYLGDSLRIINSLKTIPTDRHITKLDLVEH